MPYKNNTTNLYVYLERHHKEEYVKLSHYTEERQQQAKQQQQLLPETVNRIQPLSRLSEHYKRLTNSIALFIAKDLCNRLNKYRLNNLISV